MTTIKKRCLAIIGLETITRPDKTVFWSDTFLNNALTWRADHKAEFETKIVDARMFRYDINPMASLTESIRLLQKDTPWDTIFYSGHSDTETLYVFSKIGWTRPELSEDDRFIEKHTDLAWLNVKPHQTKFYLYGCQAAGKYGKRIDDCIAQCIADSSKTIVYGYACKTAQAKVNGRFFQKPDIGGLLEFKPK